jgi:hypothetical protein
MKLYDGCDVTGYTHREQTQTRDRRPDHRTALVHNGVMPAHRVAALQRYVGDADAWTEFQRVGTAIVMDLVVNRSSWQERSGRWNPP